MMSLGGGLLTYCHGSKLKNVWIAGAMFVSSGALIGFGIFVRPSLSPCSELTFRQNIALPYGTKLSKLLQVLSISAYVVANGVFTTRSLYTYLKNP